MRRARHRIAATAEEIARTVPCEQARGVASQCGRHAGLRGAAAGRGLPLSRARGRLDSCSPTAQHTHPPFLASPRNGGDSGASHSVWCSSSRPRTIPFSCPECRRCRRWPRATLSCGSPRLAARRLLRRCAMCWWGAALIPRCYSYWTNRARPRSTRSRTAWTRCFLPAPPLPARRFCMQLAAHLTPAVDGAFRLRCGLRAARRRTRSYGRGAGFRPALQRFGHLHGAAAALSGR